MTDRDALVAANTRLNAFVDFDRSASAASGPLAGLSIGIKANIAVKGLPWTAGMALYRNRIADRDAKAVADLRTAGATILGMTNMEEAALGAKTDNPWFGATQNPHRSGFTPGGSSGGSGAAVAAGLCDAALGTDTMGSIRVPAAYCGIYGFKPANAAVSQDGLEICEASLDVIGPLARSLDTLEAVGRVMSDFGAGDAAASPAVLADLGGVDCTGAVRAMMAQAAKVSGTARVALPFPLSRVRFAGFVLTARSLAEALADADSALLSPHLKRLVGYGPARAPADWQTDLGVLHATAQALTAAVASHGAMLLPTCPGPAFAHSTAAPPNQADFTCIANIAGLPAISIPGGWDNGLPIGLQLIGQTGHEAGLFALARRLDTALAAYRPPTPFGY